MDTLLLIAKEKLFNGDTTCVAINDKTTWISNKRGIGPLIELYESDFNTKNAVIADLIVGKAASLMYVLMNVSNIYADIISKPAIKILDKYHISYEYNLLVDHIVNRQNNGICPMEQVTLNINVPIKAYEAIKNKLIELEAM